MAATGETGVGSSSADEDEDTVQATATGTSSEGDEETPEARLVQVQKMMRKK